MNEQFTNSLNYYPLIGQIKGVSEAITGEEWFTGRRLSSLERKAALLPMKIKGGTGVARSEVNQIIREEAAVAKSSEVQSEFLGGAKGSLYSKQNVIEVNHIPSMKSMEIAGFKVSYNEGSAFQMLYEEHRAYISTGRSKEAIAFRSQEAVLLLEGKFMEAFDLNVNRVQASYGNKYKNAISQAREYYQNTIVPQLQSQIKKPTINQ